MPKGAFMRFYTTTFKNYCGINSHARKMYICIIDGKVGNINGHHNINCTPN
jgi:hypothetical protein